MRLSSVNWLIIWLGLEAITFSFITLLRNPEFQFKYFFIQASGSLMFLISMFFSNQLFFVFSLLVKSLSFPFFLWIFPSVKKLTFKHLIILITILKVPPFYLLSCLNLEDGKIQLILVVRILNILRGLIGGIWRNRIHKLIIFSSTSQVGWYLLVLLSTKSLFLYYIISYIVSSAWLIGSFSHGRFAQPHVLVFIVVAGLPPSFFFLIKFKLIIVLARLWGSFFLALLILVLYAATVYIYLLLTSSNFISKKKRIFKVTAFNSVVIFIPFLFVSLLI